MASESAQIGLNRFGGLIFNDPAHVMAVRFHVQEQILACCPVNVASAVRQAKLSSVNLSTDLYAMLSSSLTGLGVRVVIPRVKGGVLIDPSLDIPASVVSESTKDIAARRVILTCH